MKGGPKGSAGRMTHGDRLRAAKRARELGAANDTPRILAELPNDRVLTLIDLEVLLDDGCNPDSPYLDDQA